MNAIETNRAALAILPIHNGPDRLMPGDTITATSEKLPRPQIYLEDGTSYLPTIGIVVEVLPNLVAIHWDGYHTPWDHPKREIRNIARICRSTPARVILRSNHRPIPAAYRDNDGWIIDHAGNQIAPHELAR